MVQVVLNKSPRPHSIKEWAPSMTKQCFLSETEINSRIRRFKATGVLPSSGRVPQYVDCTTIPDLQGYYEVQRRAEETYERLPAELKKRCPTFADVDAFLAEATPETLQEVGLAPQKKEEKEEAKPTEKP